MVRKTKNAKSPAQMYRHFAIVTVIITGAVAIMADDGSAEKVDEAFVAVEQYSDAQQKEFTAATKKTFGTGDLIDNSKSKQTQGSFGDDSWVTDTGVSIIKVGSSSNNSAGQPPWIRLGMSRADFEALSEEEREKLLRRLPPDNATMARISRESMRRAGRTEPSNDAPF